MPLFRASSLPTESRGSAGRATPAAGLRHRVLVRRESPSTWDLGARTREGGEKSRESETAPLLLYRPLFCSPGLLLSCFPVLLLAAVSPLHSVQLAEYRTP